MIHIPDRNRSEWKDLLKGKNNTKINSFVFQMKLTRLREDIINQEVTIEEAINELFELFNKYDNSDELSKDIKRIFNNHKQLESSISQTKDNTFIEQQSKEVLKIDQELQSLKQKLAQEKKEMQKALNDALLVKKDIAKKVQLEKEKKEALLKNVEKERKQAQIVLEKQKREKELINKQVKQVETKPKQITKPLANTNKNLDNRLNNKSENTKNKKPLMKSLLDFFNEK